MCSLYMMAVGGAHGGQPVDVPQRTLSANDDVVNVRNKGPVGLLLRTLRRNDCSPYCSS